MDKKKIKEKKSIVRRTKAKQKRGQSSKGRQKRKENPKWRRGRIKERGHDRAANKVASFARFPA